MKTIRLIIQREYLSRVRKRSFVITAILGPVFIASTMIIPILLSGMSDNGEKNISVLDETGLFQGRFSNESNMKFHYVYSDIESAKADFLNSKNYALLFIPRTETMLPGSAILYSGKQPSLDVKNYIRQVMRKELEEQKLLLEINKLSLSEEDRSIALGIPETIKTSISISTIKLGEGAREEKTYTETAMAIGIFSGIMIYFFIFMFAAQVMRGVIEEKTNRIVEVIISSVKPFQLMMGKILGIALVGLIQFLLWIVLSFSIVSIFQIVYNKQLPVPQGEFLAAGRQPAGTISQEDNQAFDANVNIVLEAINSIDFGVIIFSFAFFFLAGYLLYAALFAAVGSAVDSEADTQQFMLPITIPLIFSIIIAQFILNNPEGPLAFWLSIIPLTSPIIMMLRIPFGVPYSELALSMVLLVAGFICTTWLAARIYRTGILMYGKKASYRELWKWITFKG